MKYKKGDRVRSIGEFALGHSGKVCDTNCSAAYFVIFDDGRSSWKLEANLELVAGASVGKTPLAEYTKDYTFRASDIQAVDCDQIAKEVSREYPIAVVKVQGKEKRPHIEVIIHGSIIAKGRCIGILPPEHDGINENEYTDASIIETTNPRAWIKWAKEVRAADWSDKHESVRVEVQIPNI